MKQTIDNASQFRDAFRAMGRHGQFSYEGMELLFNYFEDVNPNMELDVIAICCDYSENTLSEIATAYNIDLTDLEGESRIEAVVEYLNEHTSIVGMVNYETIVYSNF